MIEKHQNATVQPFVKLHWWYGYLFRIFQIIAVIKDSADREENEKR